MSRTLVSTFNKYVKEDDVLIHLGDWSFGGKNNIWNFRKQLNVKDIHLCLGNHDHHIENNIELPDSQLQEAFNWSKYSFKEFEDFRIQDLFTSVQQVLEFDYKHYNFFCSHYKHAIWKGSHKGFIHLYGHSHASAENWIIGKSMDVGVDNAYKLFGEYRPFSIQEVLSLMNKRSIGFKDHHDENTNLK
jgi:calcineurin-like phosphoesterase family protein